MDKDGHLGIGESRHDSSCVHHNGAYPCALTTTVHEILERSPQGAYPRTLITMGHVIVHSPQRFISSYTHHNGA